MMQTLQIKGRNVIKNNFHPRSISNRHTICTEKVIRKPPLPPRTSRKPAPVSKPRPLKHQYVCQQRKQNILNSKFLRKKQKLFEITKQNVKIFQRINSQKSMYSHQAMNKSYEDGRSMRSSRMSNKSNSSQISLKNSRASSKQSKNSKHSQQGHSSTPNRSHKKDFFDRTSSAKKNKKTLLAPSERRKSLYHIKPKSINQTHKQDLKQFRNLFNIKQQPTLNQRNKQIRARSLQQKRAASSKNQKNPKDLNSNLKKHNQIIINQQNQIEIRQQIDEQLSRVNTCSSCNHNKGSKVNILQNSNAIPIQSRLGMSKHSISSQKGNTGRTHNEQNINLYEIKNSHINSRLIKKLGNDKIASKYTNLMARITQQIHKSTKVKFKENINHIKSRLVG